MSGKKKKGITGNVEKKKRKKCEEKRNRSIHTLNNRTNCFSFQSFACMNHR